MFVWSFIIRAVPIKKIASGVVCVIILITALLVIKNQNTEMNNPADIMLVKNLK
jgi:hypothetical protein